MAETKEMSPLKRAARTLHAETKQVRYVRDPELPTDPPSAYPEPFIEWEMLPSDVKEGYYGQARAVLQVIREPSERMLEAGRNAKFTVYRDGKDHSTLPRWQAMIDAALEEG